MFFNGGKITRIKKENLKVAASISMVAAMLGKNNGSTETFMVKITMHPDGYRVEHAEVNDVNVLAPFAEQESTEEMEAQAAARAIFQEFLPEITAFYRSDKEYAFLQEIER